MLFFKLCSCTMLMQFSKEAYKFILNFCDTTPLTIIHSNKYFKMNFIFNVLDFCGWHFFAATEFCSFRSKSMQQNRIKISVKLVLFVYLPNCIAFEKQLRKLTSSIKIVSDIIADISKMD